jgi:hypothetical protein
MFTNSSKEKKRNPISESLTYYKSNSESNRRKVVVGQHNLFRRCVQVETVFNQNRLCEARGDNDNATSQIGKQKTTQEKIERGHLRRER